MDEQELHQQLAERFKQLPKVVQEAITSADVEAHMRALAETHKLHLDQWASLENEVMLTLLGFQKTEDLAENLKKEVNVDDATARALADDISKIVFEPIRKELERQLERPAGQTGAAAPAPPVQSVPAPVIAATPPKLPPQKKAERPPAEQNYSAPVPSHERKAIEGDPYREQVK